MKFMKLGSKLDQFQTYGDNIKFPLLSKSSRLQKLVGEENDEIHIHDIPGGPAAFEICAKFCYGMIVTLNAYNVVSARCTTEYLEMYESFEKGNPTRV